MILQASYKNNGKIAEIPHNISHLNMLPLYQTTTHLFHFRSYISKASVLVASHQLLLYHFGFIQMVV